MTLGERQELFSITFAKLIIKAYELGYTVRLGDVWAKRRDPLEHKPDSEHYNKCAGDVNLFKDGKFLSHTMDHLPLGTYWESLNPACRWGGHYNDGNHYELKP